jgi:predicted phage terminase large subunit-like protein
LKPEEWAYLAANHLYLFPRFASGFQVPPHSKYIGQLVQAAIGEWDDPAKRQNRHKIFIVGGPPRHGKSELLCVHGSAWVLGKYPQKKIIIAAYQSGLAEKHSTKSRALFRKWGPILWDSHPNPTQSARSDWETSEGGGIKAVGIESGASGYGSDLLLIDDYHKDSLSAESKLQRDNVWEWWISSGFERLHPGAVVVIYATRWNDDDLCGRLLKQYNEHGDACPFEIFDIRFPALAEDNDILGRKPGEALWPWWKNKENLEGTRLAVGPYIWSALFQANPTPRGGHLFKSQNFRYYERELSTSNLLCWRKDHSDPIRINRKELVRHVYVDPALETKTINDPTGMLAWGYSRKHKIWLLLDRINDRIEHSKIHETILNFAFKNECTSIGIENEKIGKILVKQSAGNDSIGGKKISFVEVPCGKYDKYARATPMANYQENERVFFPRSAPWISNYEGWLTVFPNGAHDEDVDCTAMAQHMEEEISVLEALMIANRS